MRMAVAALMLVAAAPLNASVYKDFVAVWDARDKSYRSEREALDASASGTAERAIAALVQGDEGAADDLEMALTAAWSLSELVGRGQTLWQLREHMAAKPSAAMSEVWMQGKLDEARRRVLDADLIARQMEMLKKRDTVSVQQWIAALERLTMMRGTIAGTVSELTLIDQNLRSYYRARGEEPAGGLLGMVGKLQEVAQSVRDGQQQILQRSAQCARTGNC